MKQRPGFLFMSLVVCSWLIVFGPKLCFTMSRVMDTVFVVRFLHTVAYLDIHCRLQGSVVQQSLWLRPEYQLKCVFLGHTRKY